MNMNELHTPEDVLEYMKEHIRYGWRDCHGVLHMDDMDRFRTLYRTAPLAACVEQGFGTCIEQVFLMHTLLKQINVTSRMYCCRIFEPDDYGNLEEEEHMHCFLLYEVQDAIYHMEHPNRKRIGITRYESEDSAILAIQNFYVELRGGKLSPVTQFYTVEPGLTFQAFNTYINHSS